MSDWLSQDQIRAAKQAKEDEGRQRYNEYFARIMPHYTRWRNNISFYDPQIRAVLVYLANKYILSSSYIVEYMEGWSVPDGDGDYSSYYVSMAPQDTCAAALQQYGITSTWWVRENREKRNENGQTISYIFYLFSLSSNVKTTHGLGNISFKLPLAHHSTYASIAGFDGWGATRYESVGDAKNDIDVLKSRITELAVRNLLGRIYRMQEGLIFKNYRWFVESESHRTEIMPQPLPNVR